MPFSMDRWKGKIAVVTGASAGIGAAITLDLVQHGLKVVALARRLDRLEALKNTAKGPGELIPFKADIAVESEITAAFEFVKKRFGAIHVLVNNAGVFRPGQLTAQDPKFMREILNVNVMGLTLCTQEAYKLMKESGVDDGHIIHINSVAGHSVPQFGDIQITGMYAASKHAVTALTETLRQELMAYKSKIRVTSISPGYVETEIVQAAMDALGVPPEVQKEGRKDLDALPALKAQDISDGVIYALSTPPNVQVHELTIKPIGEPF